jgi:hypothetical protein
MYAEPLKGLYALRAPSSNGQFVGGMYCGGTKNNANAAAK